MILETIISTVNEKGVVNFAPFGITKDKSYVYISPYIPSTPLNNLKYSKCAVVNYINAAAIFVNCLIGKKKFKKKKCSFINCSYLEHSISHQEIVVKSIKDHETRPTFKCKIIKTFSHENFEGFNRAQSSIIEACILASRINLLEKEKIIQDLKFLSVAVKKTGGKRELEAWKKINLFILDEFKKKN